MNVQRKNQLQRIAFIILSIENNPVSKIEIINKLENRFDICFSHSQIEKDLFTLKMDFDAPIAYNKTLKKYYLTEEYSFKEALFNYVCI
jgi:hypothetical protein